MHHCAFSYNNREGKLCNRDGKNEMHHCASVTTTGKECCVIGIGRNEVHHCALRWHKRIQIVQ